MLFLGHIGITVGSALLLDCSLRKKYPGAFGKTSVVTRKSNALKKYPMANQPHGAIAKLVSLMRRMDYRLLLLGSMLPDIIDKPIGHLFFVDFFHNEGRLFAHTLIFVVVISLLGLFVYRKWGRSWVLILSVGCAVHLLLDEIWTSPITVLWPFLGWSFENGYTSNWWADIWHSILNPSPYVIVTEAIGVIILVVFLAVLIRRKRLYAFIRYGRW